MKYAVVKNSYVENVIVCNPEQAGEIETALNASLIEVMPYGLRIGDHNDGANWVRNSDGEQVTLPALPSYTELETTIAELDAAIIDLEYENIQLELGPEA